MAALWAPGLGWGWRGQVVPAAPRTGLQGQIGFLKNNTPAAFPRAGEQLLNWGFIPDAGGL